MEQVFSDIGLKLYPIVIPETRETNEVSPIITLIFCLQVVPECGASREIPGKAEWSS